MAVIAVQAGHCFRQTGSTGTRARDGDPTEQAVAWDVTTRAVGMLRGHGHDARALRADPPDPSQYRGDVFVAVHCDGSTSPSARGASTGFRTPEGQALAQAFKHAYHALGWRGFRPDNYTPALQGYYGTRRAVERGNRMACIVELGFLTNPDDEAQLSTPVGRLRAARAIVQAVLAHHPAPHAADSEEEHMHWVLMLDECWEEKFGKRSGWSGDVLRDLAEAKRVVGSKPPAEREGAFRWYRETYLGLRPLPAWS